MEKKKVIIDCDPGIDDALAILLALASPELEVLGITTVAGNVPPVQGAENVLKILEKFKCSPVPVYVGEKKPLVRTYIDAKDTHGDDGLGNSGLPESTKLHWRPGAVNYLLDTIKKTEGVTLLTIGPMTNIAVALQKEAKAFQNVREIISMGGNYHSFGNCSPVAEYNYWCDPDAAQLVYRKLGEMGKKIKMVGLDVTRQIVLTPNILAYMRFLNREIADFIEKITRFYFNFHWEHENLIGCVINDPLAVAYCIDPSLCRGIDAYTDVETTGLCMGQSIVDDKGFWGKRPNSYVLTRTDSFQFMSLFLSRLFKKDRKDIEIVLSSIMDRKE
ncbi:MAG TPA: nucleoside hydrolase [Ruminococcaceae bacterium]|nr:nucleoside hydrolase [Oscillospiraceae bacterium]